MTELPLAPGCEPRCRGCAHRRLTALDSETRKQDWLAERLSPWRDCLAPIRTVATADRWHYRERIRLTTDWQAGTGWRFGMYAHRELIPVPHCPIHSHRADRIIALLRETLPPAERFPLAFYAQAGAQVTLIVKTAQPPPTDWCNTDFRQRLAAIGLDGLWLHCYPAAGRHLFSKNGWQLLWGQPRSHDSSGLVYGPTAFQQLVPSLYHRSLDEAEAFLTPTADDVMVDLYCGIGASLQRWQRRRVPVIGVEAGGEAIDCARINAPAATVLRGYCAHRLPQIGRWLDDRQPRQRLLYVNPPRTGLEPAVLDWTLDHYRPDRIGYLSCSAGTLSRDLDRLTGAGLQIARIIPYDFFPQTHHVETLVLITGPNY